MQAINKCGAGLDNRRIGGLEIDAGRRATAQLG